ncbi:MAG TPA: hypothetical protein VHC42_09885 [Rhizomicrobium sp.]|nr:hypothetical protein [Rhizomicrobium sp.]
MSMLRAGHKSDLWPAQGLGLRDESWSRTARTGGKDRLSLRFSILVWIFGGAIGWLAIIALIRFL